jgi:uncharacterized protein (DUF1778 family)
MPKTATNRTERINLRTDTEIKALIERAAQLRHTTISSYLLDSTVKKAIEDLHNTETLILSNADRDRFFEALASPPQPNAALRKLFKEKRA